MLHIFLECPFCLQPFSKHPISSAFISQMPVFTCSPFSHARFRQQHFLECSVLSVLNTQMPIFTSSAMCSRKLDFVSDIFSNARFLLRSSLECSFLSAAHSHLLVFVCRFHLQPFPKHQVLSTLSQIPQHPHECPISFLQQ